jgi:hypothetical protein
VKGKSISTEMKDCVLLALEKGCSRGHEFHKMRHAIIAELKRLRFDTSEIKDVLVEWNERCERPLSIPDQRRQLFGYVDWFEKKDCKNCGCKSLEDYCVGKENCEFHKRTTYLKRQEIKVLPFDLAELGRYLEERFKADGYSMMLVVKALRVYQVDKITGEVMFIGIRRICSIIRDKLGHNLHRTDIHRKVCRLIEEGVLEKTVQGRSGEFRRKSNGYRFLPWKRPTGTHKIQQMSQPPRGTHNNSYVSQTEIHNESQIKTEGEDNNEE